MSETNGMLTRDDILAKDDLPVERVSVPEWGGHVYVRTLSARERDAFEAAQLIQGKRRVRLDLQDVRARFAALVICDQHGKPLFTHHDIPKLTSKSAAALNRIYEAGQRLNGMTDEDFEELAKNSGTIPNDNASGG